MRPKQSSPFFVASATALLLVCFCSPEFVEAAAGHESSASATSSSWYSCSSSSSSSSSSLSLACAGIHRKQPTKHSSRHIFGIGVAGNASTAASTCRKGLAVRGGGGGKIFQDPAVKNDFFGTPNTFVPAAYPWLDLAFVVGYTAIIYAMPGSVGSLHKMIHIAWCATHIVLVGITNYGVPTLFPNKPALPLKLMYSFDASWAVFVALVSFVLDQGSEAWNLFWHIAGAVSLASIPFLDFKADVRKGLD